MSIYINWDFERLSVPQNSITSYQWNGGYARNGYNRVPALADDKILYKMAKDAQTAFNFVQEQLEKVSQWCQEAECESSPSKAQALWSALSSEASEQGMTAVRPKSFRYRTSIRFTEWPRTRRRRLNQRHSDAMKDCRALKAKAARGIEQCNR